MVGDVVELGLLQYRDQCREAAAALFHLVGADGERLGVVVPAGVVDELVGGVDRTRLQVGVLEGFGGGEALVGNGFALGNEELVALVVGVDLVGGHDALGDEVLHVGDRTEHADGVDLGGDVGDRLCVGVGVGVPHDDLGADVQGGEDGDRREVLREFDGLVGVHVAEQYIGVLEHRRDHRLAAEKGATGTDLEIDSGVLAAGKERTGHRPGVLVDRVSGADQLVAATVLGLGEPVGLDHHGGRATRLGQHPVSRQCRLGTVLVVAAGAHEDDPDQGGCDQSRFELHSGRLPLDQARARWSGSRRRTTCRRRVCSTSRNR